MKAALQVLLAAAELGDEFSEWDLSVKAWRMFPERFWMQGGHSHPDHKRVYAELVRLRKGGDAALLERVRPNVYRVTARGKAVAASLKDTTSGRLFGALLPLHTHSAFWAWRRDPSQPTTRKALGLFDLDAAELVGEAIAWMTAAGVEYLYCPANEVFVHASTVAELGDFITAMRARFPAGKQLAGAV